MREREREREREGERERVGGREVGRRGGGESERRTPPWIREDDGMVIFFERFAPWQFNLAEVEINWPFEANRTVIDRCLFR